MTYDPDHLSMYQACLMHSRADRVLRTIISNLLEQSQLTMMEWLLLGVVNEGPNEGISLSQIAQALDVSQPQVTALMDKVQGPKLVRQKVHRQDRRSRTVVLTAKGKRLLEKVETTISDYMKEWLTEVPREQLVHYVDMVDRIANYKLPDR